ncbi:MAG: sugar ABC transporter permease [Clostridiales bacterium]|nr:sugar ABC transporter permease [Clostridiales bacterium]
MASEKTIPTWKQFNRPWYEKLGLSIWGYIKNVGLMIWNVIKRIPFAIWGLLCAIGRGFEGLWFRFVKGDWRTKISYLIMGFGCFTRSAGQLVKGFLLLAVEALYVVYMVLLGGPQIAMFGTLGTKKEGMDLATGEPIPGDNSLAILIFSVMTIIITIFFIYMWVKNTKIAYNTQKRVEEGKPLSNLKQQLNYVLNDGYHITVLALPIFGILLITVLPLVCNILIAFTNYGYKNGITHYPPQELFTWKGFSAFGDVFGQSYGSIIWSVLGWTLIWAVFATFTNFFFGMFLAMMINKKSIKMKAFWRTCFIIVIAVPDFVTLLMMNQFFSYNPYFNLTGPFNQILSSWFGIKFKSAGGIDWFGGYTGKAMNARIMVIVVNLWRGMPFTMLATSGILMNIPEELYESSRIDGAGPVRRFVSITFPYIMFVMAPQLITTFTGNINNFNVIYFLTGGGPDKNVDGSVIGATDLLVTWLYALTIERQHPEYNYGAVLGIFMFIITSFFALIVFNSSKSNTQEDTFK